MSRHITDQVRIEAPALQAYLRIDRKQGPGRVARALLRRPMPDNGNRLVRFLRIARGHQA